MRKAMKRYIPVGALIALASTPAPAKAGTVPIAALAERPRLYIAATADQAFIAMARDNADQSGVTATTTALRLGSTITIAPSLMGGAIEQRMEADDAQR